MTVGITSRAIVLCPLAFERAAVCRALSSVREHFEIICCGPGGQAIKRWADGAHVPAGTRVILAGLAGGLDPELITGKARWVGTVISQDGSRWTVPLVGPGAAECEEATESSGDLGVSVVSEPAPVCTIEQKRDLRERTGADMVDLESAAFARLAGARGWRWGIVRGVSDGADDPLPAGIERWVDSRGRSRPGMVLRSLVRRPGDLKTVLRLRSAARSAMEAVGLLVRVMVEEDRPDW